MRRGSLLIVGALFAISIIIGIHTPVKADANVAQGLQISPVIIELNADKGQTYNLKLSILNVTTGDLVFNTTVNDFRSKDETGTPEVLLNSSLPSSASVITWIQPLGSIALKTKQTKNLSVTITIPSNAEAGGHYGVIRFSGTAPELQQSSVSLAASAGVLLLVRVSGNITEKLNLIDFYTQQGSKRRGWFETSPVTFVERINNTGNVHVKPQGDLVITNMFGKHVATLKVNDNGGNVLPKSVRRFEESLNKKRLFGKYTVSMSLGYGTQGKVLMGNLSFWVIPYKTIALILLIVVIIILLIRLLMKRYNRWIVARSGR